MIEVERGNAETDADCEATIDIFDEGIPRLDVYGDHVAVFGTR